MANRKSAGEQQSNGTLIGGRWSEGARMSLSRDSSVNTLIGHLVTSKVYACVNCLVSGRSIVYVW